MDLTEKKRTKEKKPIRKTGTKRVCLLIAILLSGISTGISSCSKDNPVWEQSQPPVPGNGNGTVNENKENNEPITSGNMNIRIGNQRFTATLANNKTATAFKALLPMNITMNELNGNEKYCNLSTSLPTDARRPGTIQAGDLMLYGSGCIVLFYKTFSSSYSYTRIGRIDNPEKLSEAAGTGDIQVVFEAED